MLWGSAGARSCSDDLCFMDSVLVFGAQGKGVGISFPASGRGSLYDSQEQLEGEWLNVPQFKSPLPPDSLEA